MSASRVLVVGAAGRLGAAVVEEFGDSRVFAYSRATLDITDAAAVARVAGDVKPAVIINCAAYNQVDAAEDAPTEAFAVNAFAVRLLARAAEQCGATLVHYSSDFVFDGTASSPYTEDDQPAPRSAYAMSKLMGEWFAADAPRALVLRVESLFGEAAGWTGRRGTLDGMIGGIKAGNEVTALTDRVVTPSYVADVAAATRFLVDNPAAAGLYHCVNSGSATWYEVAAEAARQLGITPRLRTATMAEMPLPAARPRFCAMSNEKLAAAGFVMPSWRDALARWLGARHAQVQ